jgi:Cu/Ag efflux protein CusF
MKLACSNAAGASGALATLLRLWALATLVSLAPVPALAQPAPASAVFTRATVRATFEQDHGRRLYISLRLNLPVEAPFSALTFRVRDRALVAGLRPGASVEFQAGRIDGENVVTAIRPVPPCVRFQPC